ncbi:hypothetical protein ABZ464_24435 [Streptomyces sp. NPDC005820]|uniref:hypothetical protein n=1 Tax=Streptomyces sp. NPDC005820 TaxID=3157069 RepID=UPI00340E1A96
MASGSREARTLACFARSAEWATVVVSVLGRVACADDALPGDTAVWSKAAGGIGHTLFLSGVEPIPDDGRQSEAYAWDAVAAAIGNHPDCVSAELVSKPIGLNLDTITAITRTDDEYTLKLTVTPPRRQCRGRAARTGRRHPPGRHTAPLAQRRRPGQRGVRRGGRPP